MSEKKASWYEDSFLCFRAGPCHFKFPAPCSTGFKREEMNKAFAESEIYKTCTEGLFPLYFSTHGENVQITMLSTEARRGYGTPTGIPITIPLDWLNTALDDMEHQKKEAAIKREETLAREEKEYLESLTEEERKEEIRDREEEKKRLTEVPEERRSLETLLKSIGVSHVHLSQVLPIQVGILPKMKIYGEPVYPTMGNEEGEEGEEGKEEEEGEMKTKETEKEEKKQ